MSRTLSSTSAALQVSWREKLKKNKIKELFFTNIVFLSLSPTLLDVNSNKWRPAVELA